MGGRRRVVSLSVGGRDRVFRGVLGPGTIETWEYVERGRRRDGVRGRMECRKRGDKGPHQRYREGRKCKDRDSRGTFPETRNILGTGV